MRRPSKFFPNKLSADSQRLISLALEAAKATSRLEKRVWENSMDGIVQKLLKGKRQEAIDAALDRVLIAWPSLSAGDWPAAMQKLNQKPAAPPSD